MRKEVMKTTQLAVVWPVPSPPQNTRQIHQTVWAQTADLLKPGLGTLYASFYPASQAWGVSLNTPFGVLLGRDAPTDFVHILAAATAAQEAAIDFHVKSLLAGVNPDQVREVGSTLICPVHLDGTDKELEGHTLWQIGFASGVPLPDCGVYYAQQQRSLAGAELKKTIASHLAGYALCVVTLETGENKEESI